MGTRKTTDRETVIGKWELHVNTEFVVAIIREDGSRRIASTMASARAAGEVGGQYREGSLPRSSKMRWQGN